MDVTTPAMALLAAATAAAAAGWWRERSQRLKAERRLAEVGTQFDTLVTHDVLTGLRGRAEFEAALDQAVMRCDQGGPPVSVLYVDLDNMKSVNDAFGHALGDALLREAAGRLAKGEQIASRIAADEFAVLVVGDRTAALAHAKVLSARLGEPFKLEERPVRLTCSIGIAGYPHHGSRPRLVGHALLAMRSVKAQGGGAYAEYTAQLGEAQREQAELLQDLQNAEARGEFELYYQPKVDAQSLQVTAAEALLRWKHPRRGMVSPAVFIPLAEKHGQMARIGDWVIREATRQAGLWRREGLRMRVAVNLSGTQLRHEDLVPRIEAALAANQIPASRFTCEITESVAMEDTRVTQQAFERLRTSGLHVSIDDFGTGHSSLASLRRLPAGELKIDRAFVSDLETSADARAIVSAIVKMAHTLELRVVAEGVETEGQRDLLVKSGCDELQGYLFARPMTAAALSLWASDERPEGDHIGGFRPSLWQETQPADS